MGNSLYWIRANKISGDFPDTSEALTEPDGLLAAGGDLTLERLILAYRNGIFPWFSDGQPILWWAPNPRSVLFPDVLKISRSLRRTLKRDVFNVTVDQAFDQVIQGCAAPRRDQSDTWITTPMITAYENLYRHGYAHSVECWSRDELVGGLYGVTIGQVFFGESMFSKRADASKVALVELAAQLLDWDYKLIDCQIHNAHLASLGATRIPRRDFNALLYNFCARSPTAGAWARARSL